MSGKTWAALLKEGTEILVGAGIEEAGLDAWLLLEYASGMSRARYFAHSMEMAEQEVQEAYQLLIEKRSRHIPVQHLTHQAFFMGYEFYVDENVLVPRQDTETLVEEVLLLLKDREAPKILDMCTGSGCILESILMERTDARGTGADLSEKALEVAKRNAQALEVSDRAELVKSDLFAGDYFKEEDREYDLIVSNPPYIPTKEIQELMEEVRFHDPYMALDGKEDGLYFYRRITEEAGRCLKPGGWLAYEIGCSQGADVKEIMRTAGYTELEVKQDLAGLDRVVRGRKPVTR